jgi:outer membrane protein assembly factor BamB
MKRKLFLSISVMLFSIIAYCQSDVFQSEKLKKNWETSGLDVPESVMPVPDQNIIYVSNIGGSSPAAKDSNGFISVLSMDGKIISLKWAVGLNSPKGMGIWGNNLYVTDVDRIAQIDRQTGKIIKFYPIEGSLFLNDIAVSNDGKLYITDSQTKKVYLLDNGKTSEIVYSDTWGYPNGIINYGNKFLVGVGDRLILVNPATKSFEDFMLNTGGIDGLANVEKDTYIFSDWSGRIYKMEKGKEKELLLDTSKTEKMKAADFGYLADKKILFVPTFFGNSIACYQLTK